MKFILRCHYVAIIAFAVFAIFAADKVIKEEFSGIVLDVSKGDTLSVQASQALQKALINIRLNGIECPENSQKFGRQARFFTSNCCLSTPVKVLVYNIDSEGNKIADVILPDGKNLGQEIVKAGYAWGSNQDSDGGNLYLIQTEAKRAERGLWKDPYPVPPWEFRKAFEKDKQFKVDPITTMSSLIPGLEFTPPLLPNLLPRRIVKLIPLSSNEFITPSRLPPAIFPPSYPQTSSDNSSYGPLAYYNKMDAKDSSQEYITKSQVQRKKALPSDQTRKIYSIFSSPDQFKERFNKAAEEHQWGRRIGNYVTEQTKEYDYYYYKFTDDLGVAAIANKQDQSICEIDLCAKSAKNKSQADFLVDSVLFLSALEMCLIAVDPDASSQERGMPLAA
ncbi:MAG: thermonuclease family protein [Candidatus Sumerlaeota bacterium]|nr:thermonuclease family protein [Candidatus Sumerlaeota bacterium]